MADLFGSGLLPQGSRILWEKVLPCRTFSLGFFFPSGSRHDPSSQAGLAHLVEHLVFKGTQRFTASELARKVDRVGGDLNAWTDREEMAFTCTVPAEHWETAVESLVELCFHPVFPDAEFDREKEVIRNEILATLEDPEEMAYDEFLRLLDPGPWSRPVAGTEQSLAGLTLNDVKTWWQKHLRPSAATIVMTGAMDLETVRCRLESLLAASTEDVPTTSSFHTSEFRSQPVCRVVPADFQMVQVLGGFHFARPATLRLATVWQIFSMLWGETMSSRLFQSLREQKGLCYSVTSQIFDTETEWGLQFFTTGAPENTQALVAALKEEVRRLRTHPPTASEWEDARLALHGSMILGSEKMENRVQRLWRFHQSFDVREPFETALAALEVPVTEAEQTEILATMAELTPSLLVWGKTRLRSSTALERLWMD